MKNILLLASALLITFACSPKKAATDTTEDSAEAKIIHDIDKLLADLPNPADIPSTLKAIEADFGDSLVNSLDNLSKYMGDEDKLALNMGVYAADVSYLAVYHKGDKTMDYVRMCHQIGEILGDSAIFKQDLLDHIEASLDDETQLSNYLRGMIVETSIQLEKDHHLSMAALALTGSFIEELYQAVNVIENYHRADMTKEQEKAKVEPLVKLVLAQEQPLLDLIQLLNDIPQDDTIRRLLIHLDILDRMYKGELAIIEEKLKEDPAFIVDRDIMYAATLEIERIRADIIK